MIGKTKRWMCVALMAFAMSASAFIPKFQTLEHFFSDSGKTDLDVPLRGTMAPAVATASVFNPSAMARGIANDYQANYRFSGSHYNAANLTFNPVVRGFLNASQATDGIGYKYNNAGTKLSTGQRIGSGKRCICFTVKLSGFFSQIHRVFFKS